MNTQQDLVLHHLYEYNSITSMEAFELYGITRLSAIILRLRSSGNNIETINKTGKNRYGKTTHFAKYVLV